MTDLGVRESSWVVVPPYNRAGASPDEQEAMRWRWANHAHAGLLFDWPRVEAAATERLTLRPR